MSRIICIFYAIVLLLENVSGDNVVQENIRKVDTPDLIPNQEFDFLNPDMEAALQTLEELGKKADKINQIDSVLTEDPEPIYDEMIEVLDNIIEAVENSNNAYKFLKAKGLDRIVQQNLRVDYKKLKTRILILLKVLFEVAPTTTSAVIPVTIVDKLLDVFEKDNLALKAHSLDVLYVWLPDNPRVQARVMKIKGLVPFYDQVANLDTSVIKTLLDLFNNILKEHLKARDDLQRTIVDNEKMKFYLRIGLLEHMSTAPVCNGLLNIFSKTIVLSYNTEENNIIMTVFDMLKNIKQFCLKIYRGKVKAKKFFTALQEYMKDPENIEYIEANGLNSTDLTLVIEDYVDKLEYSVKDEM